MQDYAGFGSFVWGVGVVEDRDDPLKIGRVRVRVLGLHTEDKTEIPTEDLPWAPVLNPVTSAGISGVGETPGLVPGTWVMLMFRDGKNCQQPLVLGSLSGINRTILDPEVGFSDPSGEYPRVERDANGVIPESDINRLARNDDKEHPSLEARRNAVKEDVQRASGAPWSQPQPFYDARYPQNHVTETESGHLLEMDDTPDAERVHLRHRTGTGVEVGPDGTSVQTIEGDSYKITKGDEYVAIEGDVSITAETTANLRIQDQLDVEITEGNVNIVLKQGNLSLTVVGNVEMEIDGDLNERVTGNNNRIVDGNINIRSSSQLNLEASGSVNVRGATINLN